jgi:hypothetical protein
MVWPGKWRFAGMSSVSCRAAAALVALALVSPSPGGLGQDRPGPAARYAGRDFLNEKYSKWDGFILDFTFVGLGARLLTYNWENVRVTPLEIGGGMALPGEFVRYFGFTAGFGGHSGVEHVDGTFFTTGLRFGTTESFELMSMRRTERLEGLFIPVGIEATTHYGDTFDWVWGYRFLMVINVWGTRHLGRCDPPGSGCWILCVDCGDVAAASPIYLELGLFWGF